MASTPDLRNSLVVTRGKKKDLSLAVWDAVGPCTGNEDADEDRCPLHLDCPYLMMTNPNLLNLSTGGRTDPDKCVLQAKYLDYVYKSLVLDNQKNLDQHQVDSIGLHLVPLYGHLIKFKMVEFVLGNNTMLTGGKGAKCVHPIYKEIRETLKTICTMWHDIGIRSAKLPASAAHPDFESLMLNGDPNYYQELCEVEEPPKPRELTENEIKGNAVVPKRYSKLLKSRSLIQKVSKHRAAAADEKRRYNRERGQELRDAEKAARPKTVEEELEAFDAQMDERVAAKPVKDEDKGTTRLMTNAVEPRQKEKNRMIRASENNTRSGRLRKRIPTN